MRRVTRSETRRRKARENIHKNNSLEFSDETRSDSVVRHQRFLDDQPVISPNFLERTKSHLASRSPSRHSRKRSPDVDLSPTLMTPSNNIERRHSAKSSLYSYLCKSPKGHIYLNTAERILHAVKTSEGQSQIDGRSSFDSSENRNETGSTPSENSSASPHNTKLNIDDELKNYVLRQEHETLRKTILFEYEQYRTKKEEKEKKSDELLRNVTNELRDLKNAMLSKIKTSEKKLKQLEERLEHQN
eukprot:UC4_evm1s250